MKHIFSFIPEELIQHDGTRGSHPHIWLYPDIKIEFKSGDNPNLLVGEGVNGIYITETARLKESVWNENLYPTLSDHQGWGIFTTTPSPEGRNWYVEQIYNIAIPGPDHNDQYVSYIWHTADNTCVPGLKKEVEFARKTMPLKYFLRNYEANINVFQGQIYEDFQYDIHVVDFKIDLKRYKVVVAGVDWGYTHNGVIMVIGITDDDDIDVLFESSDNHIPVLSEVKTQDTWVKRALKIQKEYGVDMFHCGPDEPEHIQAFKDSGIWARAAKNAVSPGIQSVATFMHIDDNGKTKFRIHKKNCPTLAKYIPSYAWKEGKEEPIKENDDECDGLRYGIHSAREWFKYVPDIVKEAS